MKNYETRKETKRDSERESHAESLLTDSHLPNGTNDNTTTVAESSNVEI